MTNSGHQEILPKIDVECIIQVYFGGSSKKVQMKKSDEKENDVVCQRHFDEALERVKPWLNSSLFSICDKFRASKNTS